MRTDAVLALAAAAAIAVGALAARIATRNAPSSSDGPRARTPPPPPGDAPALDAPTDSSTPPPRTPVGAHVIAGVVVDEDRRPIPDAVVDSPQAGEESAVVTDATGAFRLPLTGQESKTVLRVRAAGHVERRLPGPKPGETSVLITLAPGRAISGRVVDETSTPVAGALVSTLESEIGRPDAGSASGPRAHGGVDTARFDEVGRATTGPDGVFLLVDLSEGGHVLHVRAPGRELYTTTARAPRAGLEIRLPPRSAGVPDVPPR